MTIVTSRDHLRIELAPTFSKSGENGQSTRKIYRTRERQLVGIRDVTDTHEPGRTPLFREPSLHKDEG